MKRKSPGCVSCGPIYRDPDHIPIASYETPWGLMCRHCFDTEATGPTPLNGIPCADCGFPHSLSYDKLKVCIMCLSKYMLIGVAGKRGPSCGPMGEVVEPEVRIHLTEILEGYSGPVIIWEVALPKVCGWVTSGVYDPKPRVFPSVPEGAKWVEEMSEPIEFEQDIPDYYLCCLLTSDGNTGWQYAKDFDPYMNRIKRYCPKLPS